MFYYCFNIKIARELVTKPQSCQLRLLPPASHCLNLSVPLSGVRFSGARGNPPAGSCISHKPNTWPSGLVIDQLIYVENKPLEIFHDSTMLYYAKTQNSCELINHKPPVLDLYQAPSQKFASPKPFASCTWGDGSVTSRKACCPLKMVDLLPKAMAIWIDGYPGYPGYPGHPGYPGSQGHM